MVILEVKVAGSADVVHVSERVSCRMKRKIAVMNDKAERRHLTIFLN